MSPVSRETSGMRFRRDEDGLHLVGNWDRQTAFDPRLIGEVAGLGTVQTTIKVRTADGWALYRVDGFTPAGALSARLLRRGRG